MTFTPADQPDPVATRGKRREKLAGRRELVVDRIACTGHGLCASWLPERVRLDEWGYPVVTVGPVPVELLAHARRAAAECPVRALLLR
ncbi:MAG: ferredoxin [Propionibacteriaceae bacterium]